MMEKRKTAVDALRKEMRDARLPLKSSAAQLVFGEGPRHPAVMFIGEAPGRKEDESGRPFVGAAGCELDTLLRSISLQRKDVYITSVLKYRPPKNRDPRASEVSAHVPFLIRQIELLRPRVLATLGNWATRLILAGGDPCVMGAMPPIGKVHGTERNIRIGKRQYTVLPLYHPAAILYNRSLEDVARKDIQYLKKVISNGSTR
ncbi:MAG: uracil-DNA glycosylase [Candidatus Omnitrophota bacterium]